MESNINIYLCYNMIWIVRHTCALIIYVFTRYIRAVLRRNVTFHLSPVLCMTSRNFQPHRRSKNAPPGDGLVLKYVRSIHTVAVWQSDSSIRAL